VAAHDEITGGRRHRRFIRYHRPMRFASRVFSGALSTLVLGCGARTDLGAGGGEADDVGVSTGGVGGGTGSGGAPGDCDVEATRSTLPGPCAPQGLECDGACGACPDQRTCVSSRCYDLVGPGAIADGGWDLTRGVYTEPEGERCTIREDGVLEGVRVIFGTTGVSSITMEVFVSCDGGRVLAHSSTLPASAFPAQGLIGAPTTFPIDPPVQLRKDELVEVMFHADDAVQFHKAFVAAIDMSSVDPDCRYWPEDAQGANGTSNWDLRMDLLVH
jgi:hypothetical protein